MAQIAWSDVVAFAASLSSTPASQQLDVLEFVNRWIAPESFGGEESHTLRMARIYLAAHLATATAGNSGVTGAVTSESIGGMSRSYAVLAADSGLDKTSYGGVYKNLIKNSVGRLPFVP